MSDKLLPCPCCGGEAEFDQYVAPEGYSYDYIGCVKCGLRMPESYSYDATVSEWNTRTPPEGYVARDEMNQKVIDAVSAARKRWAKSDQDLDGYVLVPVEPTEEMLDTGTQALIDTLENKVNGIEPDGDGRKAQYKAMIKAAEVKQPTVELTTVLLPEDTDKFKADK